MQFEVEAFPTGEFDMSNKPSPLSKEQLDEINSLLDAAKEDWISTVSSSVQSKQAEIAATVKTEIDQAVAKNQRVVLATVQAGAEQAASSGRAKAWEALKLLLPVIATALLGFVVWKWQSDIQKKIDHQNELVKVELGLKGEFAKRKLDMYQDILKQMAEVGSRVRAAQRNNEKKADLWPALLKFNETVNSKRIYISDDAFKALLEFWQAGLDIFRGQATLDNLQEKNSRAEDEIANDLDIKTLGKLKLTEE